MEEGKINLHILEDENLFLGIHRLKTQFVSLFSGIANQISDQELAIFHPAAQGSKITKGNELQHCPYQVLDLVRNFDKKEGFNIRFLNWWGNGLYVLVFFGSERPPKKEVFNGYQQHGFETCITGSPWDYTGIIKHGRRTLSIAHEELPHHVKRYRHLQMVKHIPFPADLEKLREHITAEWLSLKKIHDI